jgi:hypothetical protein
MTNVPPGRQPPNVPQAPQPPIPPTPPQLTPAQALDWNKWVQEQNIAWQKWLYEQNMKAAERAHDKSEGFGTRANEAAVQGANLALRHGLLINGGAAVALLTFIGTLSMDQKRAIAATLACFVWGVVAATAALATAYFTNYYVAQCERSRTWQPQSPYVVDGPQTSKWRFVTMLFRIASIVLGLVSLALFIIGMLAVQTALTKLA